MYQQSSSCNRSLYKISVLIFVEKQRLIIMTAVTVEFNMACILEDGEEGGGGIKWSLTSVSFPSPSLLRQVKYIIQVRDVI